MIYLTFFLSGISGLIYQVIWVREFGQIFGNTIESAALITGVFVLNLGIGSLLGGLFVDKTSEKNKFSGLLYYVRAEVVIALLGIVLAFAIPWLKTISPAISSYTVGANGWFELSTMSYALRYLIAILFLAPSTLLMGATLTFLIRYILKDSVNEVGWKVGLLYGLNTLGAALGCLAVDMYLVPSYGLYSTKFVAVFFNIVAACMAFKLYKNVNTTQLSEVGDSIGDSIGDKKIWPEFIKYINPTSTGIAIFISGFAAMGFEIVWFRYLSSVETAERSTFSLLLATILIGMWLGSIIGGKLTDNSKKAARNYMYAQIGFVITAVGSLLYLTFVDRMLPSESTLQYFNEQASLTRLEIIVLYRWAIPAVALLPSFFMGFAFPMANAMIQENKAQAGRTAGHIYIWNSMGAILGSVFAGFVLIPMLGIQNSIVFLALVSLMVIIPLAKFFNPISLVSGVGLTAALGLIVFLGMQHPNSILLSGISRNPERFGKKIVQISEGVTESIIITEKRASI